MAEFFDYDPATGVREDFDYDPATGKTAIHYSQDVEGALEYAAAARASGEYDHSAIKECWWHYAILPPVIQLDMLTRFGVNVHKKEHRARVFDLINREYPLFKMTNLKHALRAGQS
jgi:hypothetical protein